MDFLLSADWVLFVAFHDKARTSQNIEAMNNGTDGENFSTSTHFESDQSNHVDNLPLAWNEQILSFFEQRFEGFMEIAVPAFAVSYIFFFGIGGFLHVSVISRLQ